MSWGCKPSSEKEYKNDPAYTSCWSIHPCLIVLCVIFSAWRHLVSKFSCLYTESGEVYTWGWKECVPSGKVFGDPSLGGSTEKDVFERQSSFLTEQGTFSN